ncbi:MAG: hypothetical protein IT577_18055 [Verrucomicrobiae bacterium]|nr:hypothetical protein [Verrucomicrobiae bacterium]
MKPLLAICLVALMAGGGAFAADADELRTMPAKPGSPAEVVAGQQSLRAKLLKLDDLIAGGAKTPSTPSKSVPGTCCVA